MILAGVLLADGRAVDVTVEDGRIAAVAPAAEARGYLLLPAPVEPHAHLDKAYTADRVPNPAGDLAGAIAAWMAYRPALTHADIVERATRALRAAQAAGVAAVRTHVDVDTDIGLLAVSALAEARTPGMGGAVGPVQIVAMVGTPVTGSAGAANRALLADALDAGADVVGGAPLLDPDPAGAVAVYLAAAERAGRPVDLHIDETTEPAAPTLDLLARLAVGFPQPVVASHCVSLGALPPDNAARVADRVAAAGIVVVCLPQTNLYLQGRDRPARGLTALRTLRAAGVTVAAGGDNTQDPFNPLGRGDPLETAALLVVAGHETPERAYEAVSAGARAAMGLPAVEIVPGAPADLLAVRAGSVREALATCTPDRVVLREGRVVHPPAQEGSVV
jgi:cytosine deaminase